MCKSLEMDEKGLDEESRTFTNIFTRKRRGTRVIDTRGALVHPAADCWSYRGSSPLLAFLCGSNLPSSSCLIPELLAVLGRRKAWQ